MFVCFFFFKASAATDCSFASLCVYIDICPPLMGNLCTEVIIECYITSCFLFHCAAFFFFICLFSSLKTVKSYLHTSRTVHNSEHLTSPRESYFGFLRSKTHVQPQNGCTQRTEAVRSRQHLHLLRSPPSLLCPRSNFCACLK